ncbi:MAG: glycerophosphodiester phosphodiesterase [Clostridia bacterium]|nr:glycerophosphodiester phosphodiesterase [Clostridia bacterium]
MHKVEVWAHRGASGYAPENTMEAFALAISQGADGIELDVHLSADGHVVVIHDETVDHVSDGFGRVIDLTLAALKTLNVHKLKPRYANICRIPTLEEVLRLVTPTGLALNIELKNNVEPYPGLEEKCVELVKHAGMSGRVWFSSFNHQSLGRLKAIDSSLRCGALYGKAPPDILASARSLGIEALHPHHGTLRNGEALVAACHADGLRVHAWTVNNPRTVRTMARSHVDAVITDYPDKALKALGRG